MKTIRHTTALALTAVLLAGGCATAGKQEAAPVEPLSYDAELNASFDDSIERVTAALKAEGFGIISRIDLHSTFKAKLDVDMPPHTILGACNPKLAYKAVTAMPEAAMMLPCNVTVQQLDEQRVIVRIVSPEVIMSGSGLDGEPAVEQVGAEANERLKRVAAALSE